LNSYERIFGSGPLSLGVGILLLLLAITLEDTLGLAAIISLNWLRYSLFGLLTAIALFIIVWSVKSLPPANRGRKLCTSGAFYYFRHPLYAAFLSFFNIGLALLLNNYIYLIWALVCHPVAHLLIRYEENIMLKEFGHEYKAYTSVTGRFVPRLFGRSG